MQKNFYCIQLFVIVFQGNYKPRVICSSLNIQSQCLPSIIEVLISKANLYSIPKVAFIVPFLAKHSQKSKELYNKNTLSNKYPHT